MDQRPSRCGRQPLPSLLPSLATAKEPFLLKPFHLPLKLVPRPPTPGSPPLGALSLVNPGKGEPPPNPRPQEQGSNTIKEIKSSMDGKKNQCQWGSGVTGPGGRSASI